MLKQKEGLIYFLDDKPVKCKYCEKQLTTTNIALYPDTMSKSKKITENTIHMCSSPVCFAYYHTDYIEDYPENEE